MMTITGVLDISRVEELRAPLLALLDSPEPCLELSALTACDTAGLQLLIAAGRSAAAAGRPLRLLHPSPVLSKLAATLGLTAALPEVQL